jgi:hypothetical protein
MTLLDWIRVAAEAELAVAFRKQPKSGRLALIVYEPRHPDIHSHECELPTADDYRQFGQRECDARAGRLIRESIASLCPQAVHGAQLGPKDYQI